MEVIHLNFLEKLDYLMRKENLNKSTLSKPCNIPYTTIDGWYKKGYEGLKLTTLRKLSNYFGTSLDFWANDSILSPEEKTYNKVINNREVDDDIKNLLAQYSQLNDIDKKLVHEMIKSLAQKNNCPQTMSPDLYSDIPKTPEELEAKYPPITQKTNAKEDAC